MPGEKHFGLFARLVNYDRNFLHWSLESILFVVFVAAAADVIAVAAVVVVVALLLFLRTQYFPLSPVVRLTYR